jgi:hypothetical protein
MSKKRNYSPDNNDKISQRIIQYCDDPKDSDALAEIKKLSQNAKNQNIPEKNRFLFRKNDNDNKQFVRRKHHFKTQKYEPNKKNDNLIDEIKTRMNEGKKDEDENNYDRREYFEHKEEIRVNLKVENDNKQERRRIRFNNDNKNEIDKNDNNKNNNKFPQSNLKKSDKKLEIKRNYEEIESIRRRNFSPDNNDIVSNRIVQYLDDPKESGALAEVKKISMKAKKQYSKNWDNLESKNNRVMFKEADNEAKQTKTANAPFERRKKNFSTQKYVVKNKKKTLIDELNERKNEKEKNENNQSKKENETTQKIFQYFEDPKESSALAEIKKLSQKAKNQGSKY